MYYRLKLLLPITWSLYPVIWLLSPEWLGMIDLDTEIGMQMVLDLFAKGFFGYFLLVNPQALDKAVA